MSENARRGPPGSSGPNASDSLNTLSGNDGRPFSINENPAPVPRGGSWSAGGVCAGGFTDVLTVTFPAAWRRLVAYLLQAFAAKAARPLPAPPSEQQMYRALLRLQPSRD